MPSSSVATCLAVLVVDDDADMLELLKRMVVRLGFTAMTAVNGKDALHQLRARPACLVVTDILMPEMDGIELIRRLGVEKPGIPVIAVSGGQDWEMYLRIARALGAAATLFKPISMDELRATVHRTLTQAARLHRLGDDRQLLLGLEAPPAGDTGDHLDPREHIGHRRMPRTAVETGCSSQGDH